MSIPITAGSAAAFRRIPCRAVLKSDGITAATGETGAPFIITNGGTPTTSGVGSLVEVGAANAKGEYYVELDADQVEAADIGNLIVATFETGTAVFVFETVKIATAAKGLRAITIAIEDQGANPVPGVRVDVYDATNTFFLARLDDDDLDGIVAIDLADATYKLRIFKSGFTADAIPATLVVTADAGETFTGVLFVAPISPDPSLCVVFGFAEDGAGKLHDDAVITFIAKTSGDTLVQMTNRRIIIISGPAGTPDGDPTWAPGYFEAALVRESTQNVSSPQLELSNTIEIPDADNVELGDLLPP